MAFQGTWYRRRSKTPNRKVATLFGTITLWRMWYQPLHGIEPSIFPLEMGLGLEAGLATPALAERVARAAILSSGLYATPVHHHRRDRRGLGIVRGQSASSEGLNIRVTSTRPLAADPFGQFEEVTGTNRDLQEFLQVVTGVPERHGLPRLTHGLTQDGRAVTLGTQVQLLIQGGKRRPDRSCIAIAHGSGPLRRPRSSAAALAALRLGQ
jgi:hypothetical protein